MQLIHPSIHPDSLTTLVSSTKPSCLQDAFPFLGETFGPIQILQPFRQARSNLLLLRPFLRPSFHPDTRHHHRADHLERRRLPYIGGFLGGDAEIAEEGKVDGIAVMISVRGFPKSNGATVEWIPS